MKVRARVDLVGSRYWRCTTREDEKSQGEVFQGSGANSVKPLRTPIAARVAQGLIISRGRRKARA